jgi:hypothetical protein
LKPNGEPLLEQIPLRQVSAVAIEISTLLRLSFEQFLNFESSGLMAIADLGEFKFLAIEGFATSCTKKVKASIGNNSPLSSWAQPQVIEGWNVPTL